MVQEREDKGTCTKLAIMRDIGVKSRIIELAVSKARETDSIIIGSVALMLQGYYVPTKDIDLITYREVCNSDFRIKYGAFSSKLCRFYINGVRYDFIVSEDEYGALLPYTMMHEGVRVALREVIFFHKLMNIGIFANAPEEFKREHIGNVPISVAYALLIYEDGIDWDIVRALIRIHRSWEIMLSLPSGGLELAVGLDLARNFIGCYSYNYVNRRWSEIRAKLQEILE